MIDKKHLNAAKKNALNELKLAINGLDSLPFDGGSGRQHVVLNRDLSEERIDELLKEIPTGHTASDKDADFLYVIRIESGNLANSLDLRNKLKTAKDGNKEYKYPQINDNRNVTETLYVGRSRTLRTRLRQHLGAKSKTVYALHLESWATAVNDTIAIDFLRFNKQDNLVVQAIEDGLWTHLDPVFGKKGAK
jgi:hypothetical protein